MIRLIPILLLVVLVSCGDNGATEAYAKIIAKEDSLTKISTSLPPGLQLSETATNDFIKLMDDFSMTFPEDPRAPECLDKIHMSYSGRNNCEKAIEYGKKIIENYPDYINRAMVLESVAGSYDYCIIPRDTSKVRYYYELLLKEDIDKEKQKDISERLKHLDLSLDQYIMRQ